jgi:adenylate cyclase, class 2
MNEDGVERELKIPVEEHEAVRAALRTLGAVATHDMARETNRLLDTDARRLGAAGCVLRLRRYGSRHVLTFKGPAHYDGAIKVRPEHELGIEDSEAMARIFEALGFTVVSAYEKDRESWQLGPVSVVLDRTPMGNFVEVEGPAEHLEEAARGLGLEPGDAVQGSYVSLWHDFRTRHPELELPADMVFEP